MSKKNKLIKNKCEIESCEVNDAKLLELHHIIERTEKATTNHIFNLAILCGTHHAMTHTSRLKIIGVFPSTKLPNNRTLVYELDGKRNVDLHMPYINFVPKNFKIGE
jgi:hypothetical protein